ncbi:pyridoxal-phosphate dependent enzyme [Streptomyces sannanensis]|uniref:Pyridoxal-phosphate dependent enzyme n=1 Tax=Streptomyces sannanensis TaxID=285536 RepID=A0ABP6SFN7_9ACTN
MTPEALALTALRPRLPSPLQPVEDERFARHGVRLLLKRDDLIHPSLPGNKWRKLAPNLRAAAAAGHGTLLTFGGAYSNHLRATAAAGRLLGFTTIGVVRGDELAERPLNPSLAQCAADGMRLVFVSRALYRRKGEPQGLAEILDVAGHPSPLGGVTASHDRCDRRARPAIEERSPGPRPGGDWGSAPVSGRVGAGDCFLVPEGGSNDLAVRGCAELGQELRGQAGFVGVACGTGGTLAGLAAGLEAGQRAIGFPVLKGGFLEEEIRSLQAAALGGPAGHWSLDDRFHSGGYARTTPELDAFATDFEDRHGLPVERLYVAKMLYGLTTLATEGAFPPGSVIAAVITGQPEPSR